MGRVFRNLLNAGLLSFGNFGFWATQRIKNRLNRFGMIDKSMKLQFQTAMSLFTKAEPLFKPKPVLVY
jgi:hypothetical protein